MDIITASQARPGQTIVLGQRLKPKLVKPVAAGLRLSVVDVFDSPRPGIVRLSLLLPHGEIRNVPLHRSHKLGVV